MKLSPQVKRSIQNISLCVGSLILILLVLEIGMRVYLSWKIGSMGALAAHKFNPQRKNLMLADILQTNLNKRIVYELVPNREGQLMHAPLKINSQGLRDREYAVKKPAGTFRIIGLGDSLLFGWGVPVEVTTLKALERLLNEGSPPVRYEVINFSVPGYNTVMEVETLKRKALAYEPDVVIILFCGNDLNVPAFLQERLNLLSLGRSYLLEWAAVATSGGNQALVKTLYEVQLIQPRDIFMQRDLLSLEPDSKRVPPAYRHLVGVKNYIKALEKLQRLAKNHGFPVLITFTWGDLEEWLDDKNADALIAQYQEDWPFYRINYRFGFHIVDTLKDQLAYLRRHGLRSQAFLVSENDPHPNRVQHHLIALTLYRTLVEQDLIPDAEQRKPRLSAQLERLQTSIAPPQ